MHDVPGTCSNGTCSYTTHTTACTNQACVNGACSGVCTPGATQCTSNTPQTCDASGQWQNGDLQTDPKNCGSCGHDCLGGACSSGKCQPVTLASNQDQPFDLWLDATSVFWTDGADTTGSLMKVSKNGGTPVTLASNQNAPRRLVLDQNYVYWADYGSGTVMRIATGGGTPTTLVSGLQGPYAVAVTPSEVFFSEQTALRIAKAPIGGGTASLVYATAYPSFAIVTDANDVYWNDAGIYREPLAGGTRELIIGRGGERDFDIDGAHWFDTAGGGFQIVGTGPQAANSTSTTLASAQEEPYGVTGNGSYVYWTSRTAGAIRRVLKTGGTVEDLATGQTDPLYVVVDTDAVYWTDKGAGTVMKVAK